MTFAEFASQYGALVVWLLVIAGWLVSNSAADTRECRKEVRNDIDVACTLIEKILNTYFEYYKEQANSPESKMCESRIKIMFEDLDMQIDRLRRKKKTFGRNALDIDSIVTDSDKYYDLITGGDFEGSERPATLHPVKAYQASHRALKLINALRTSFNQAF